MQSWGWEATVTVFYGAITMEKVPTFYSTGEVGRNQDQWEKAMGWQVLLQPKENISRARALQEMGSTWPHRILVEVGCLNGEDAENYRTPGSGSHDPVKLKQQQENYSGYNRSLTPNKGGRTYLYPFPREDLLFKKTEYVTIHVSSFCSHNELLRNHNWQQQLR